MNRVPESKGSHHRTDHAMIRGLFRKKDSVLRRQLDIKPASCGAEPEPFNADTKIASKKVFDVPASAPRVVTSQITIKRSENRFALSCTYNQINQELSQGEIDFAQAYKLINET